MPLDILFTFLTSRHVCRYQLMLMLRYLQALFKFSGKDQLILHRPKSSNASEKLVYRFSFGSLLMRLASSIASITSGLYSGYFTSNGIPPRKRICFKNIFTASDRVKPNPAKSSTACFLVSSSIRICVGIVAILVLTSFFSILLRLIYVVNFLYIFREKRDWRWGDRI